MQMTNAEGTNKNGYSKEDYFFFVLCLEVKKVTELQKLNTFLFYSTLLWRWEMTKKHIKLF